MTFQVTGGSPPVFQETIENLTGYPTNLVYIWPNSDTIDLSTGGSLLLGQRTFGSSERFATTESWVAIGSFSVVGLLKTFPSDAGIPITMSGKVSGGVDLLGSDSGIWVGNFSGTVDSVTFPAGMPSPEAHNLLESLGDLSRFHINGGFPNGPFQFPTYTLSMSFNIDPIESPVPEPSPLLVFALLASGYGILRHRARNAAEQRRSAIGSPDAV
jgi:hypothetical protein